MEILLHILGLILFLAIIFFIARFILRMALGFVGLLITPLIIIGIVIVILRLS